MEVQVSRLSQRSQSSLKASLLSATALVAASAVMTQPAQADTYAYNTRGPHNTAVSVTRAIGARMYATGNTTAIFTGSVAFEEDGGTFAFGVVAEPGSAIVFAPSSIAAPANSQFFILDGGTLRLGNDTARDFFANRAKVILHEGGIFDLNGSNQTLHSVNAHRGSRITNNAYNTHSTLIVDSSANTNNELAGTIADGGGGAGGLGRLGLRIVGSNWLTISGNNGYSGGTTVADGMVEVMHSNAFGVGTLTFEGVGSTVILRDGIQINNAINLADSSAVGFQVGGGELATLTGDMSGNGDILKLGAGELVLRGNRQAGTGNVIVNGGTLTALGSGSSPNAIADTATVTIGRDATFRVAASEGIGALAGTGTVLIENGARLTISAEQGATTFSGRVTGGGALGKGGNSSLTLDQANTYSGGTDLGDGTIRAAVSGALGTGAIRVTGELATLVLNNGVQLNNGIALDNGSINVNVEEGATGWLNGQIYRSRTQDAGWLVKDGAGSLVLTSETSKVAQTRVREGTLQVDGTLTSPIVHTSSGATLTGSGIINGDVMIDDGGVLAGRADQTLSINGGLSLSAASAINVDLGAPSNAALFWVRDDLTLDGTLNITNVGSFGQGVYRLFDYTGNLTDNGLEIGVLPTNTSRDNVTIQTSVDEQVNIVVAASGGPAMYFWDGSNTTPNGRVDGGTGTWGAALSNWTGANGQNNGTWIDGGFAVFQGAAGTVTVAADGVSVGGMQFAVNGYGVQGGPISLSEPQTAINVGDGTEAGRDYTARITSNITGSGALVKDGLGTLIISGTNSYQGDTIVRNGTLLGGSRSIRNNIVNDGVVGFTEAVNATFAGTVSGTGHMVKDGTGTLTLTGRNALDWVVQQGALSSTTELFRGNVTLRSASQMRFEQNASGTYAGRISGDGNGKTQLKIAAGAGNIITLTGDSSKFDGDTTVETGGLAVNGSLGGTLDVLSTARLMGTGRVGNTIVDGTIAPGNSIGTLTVAGDITFNAGSIYEVEVNAAGEGDRINASGTATIDGGAVKTLAGAGNYAASTRYTILHADGGRTGTFTGGVTSNLAFLTPTLSYDDNNVYLTMTRNGTTFQNVGVTRNQKAAGAGIESLDEGSAVYNAVLNLSAEQARHAFDQLSGEIHASIKTALLSDSRFIRDAVTNRIRAAFGDATIAATPVTDFDEGRAKLAPGTTEAFALWAQAFGSWGHWDGDGNAARFSRDTGGLLVGGDAFVADWRLGLVAGYSHSSFSLPERSSRGDSDNYHLGVYGGTEWGDIGFRSGLAYSWHNIDTSRRVVFPGFNEAISGDYHAGTFQAFGEFGYRFDATPRTTLEPFINLAHVSLHTDSFRETGGSAALSARGQTEAVSLTTLGLRASHGFTLGTVEATARGTVGWRHGFGDTTPTATHAFAGAGVFTVAGVPIGRDAALVEAGFDFSLSPSATLGLTYAGQFASGTTDQAIKANFNVKF